MKTLQEIFKGKEDLLNSPEMQEVLHEVNNNLVEAQAKRINWAIKINGLIMDSEYFCKNGKPIKSVILKIFELLP